MQVVEVGEAEGQVRIRFSVSDTGIGIPEDKLALIFEPFRQADELITRDYGGTGLGLSISRKLVDLMGGELKVQSQPGCGSLFCFELCFPVQSAPPEELSLEPALEALPSLDGLKVLLVEDNPINQLIIQQLLEREGCYVQIAKNGREGVDAVTMFPFDVVLMDIQMPILDGLSATAAIRQIPEVRGIPIIALTAHSMKGDRERCFEFGMNGFISKPVVKRAMVEEIFQCLHAKQSN
ncbi:MAG: response regulator [Bdellovibrionales bacterium]|nr:response regulator [Bdellovibrionales bacterium]